MSILINVYLPNSYFALKKLNHYRFHQNIYLYYRLGIKIYQGETNVYFGFISILQKSIKIGICNWNEMYSKNKSLEF